MSHRKSNYTLKDLQRCTSELGKLYEQLINRLTKGLIHADQIPTDTLRAEFAWYEKERYKVSKHCHIHPKAFAHLPVG